ncbi:MAG: sigma 54-interacting transcriptional regulator [Planctomycetaceae bacterium]
MAVEPPALASPDAAAGTGTRAGRPDKRWPRLESTAASMRQLEEAIGRVAEFQCPVLVTGETGCGKEEIARAIHSAGPRRAKPFLAINCGGLVASIAESQLFGHEKGAFTGAHGPSLGGFRAAHGGVLFLDEIGEMPLKLQPKLLRVLQRGEVTPVGSTSDHRVDVQVIAATNRDLEADVESGSFREDLFYRLNTVHLAVPPLRSRAEDIPRFVRHFAAHFAHEYERPLWEPPADVIQRLATHSWPGNVRQLAQTIQRIYIFEDRIDRVLDELFTRGTADPAAPLPAPARVAVTAPPPQPVVSPAPVATEPATMVAAAAPEPVLPLFNLDELRRLAVRQALVKTAGHRGRAAEMLGVSLNTMTRLVAECCPEMEAKVGRKRGVKPR